MEELQIQPQISLTKDLKKKTVKIKKKTQQNTSYNLLPNAKSFLDDLEDEIKKAKVSIDLQFYTFEADSVGKRVVSALFKAKKRGIRIRFIIDHFSDLFHSNYYIKRPRLNRKLQRSITDEWKDTKRLIVAMEEGGVEIKRTKPLGFLQRLVFSRDHKKMVIVDGEVAYIGGVNLSEHNAWWNDFMVKMKGDMIPIVKNDFNLTWEDKYSAKVSKYSDGVVLTDSRKHAEIMPFVRRLIDAAKKRVIVESPYLWGKHIKQSLIEAVERGVEVSIIVPLYNTRRFFVPRGRMLKQLIKNGIHVYQFEKSGGMTHAKALLADNVAVFGSSNFNEFLSGRLCEINIATKNKEIYEQLFARLETDMKASLKRS